MDIVQSVVSTDLIDFIKNKLNDEELSLFTDSFILYLQYDQEKDYVIDLNSIYKWLGFARIDNAKRLLTSKFIKDEDYKIMNVGVNSDVTPRGLGTKYNKDSIFMNINTFKKLCVKADTKRADTILDYYIKIEGCQNEFFKHSFKQNNLLMKQKDEQNNLLLKEKDNKIKLLEGEPYCDVNKTQFVYIFQESCKIGQSIYKIGLTAGNVDKRKAGYKTSSSDGIVEKFRFQTHNCNLLEHITKDLLHKDH